MYAIVDIRNVGIPDLDITTSDGIHMKVKPVFSTYKEAAKILSSFNFTGDYEIKKVAIQNA